MLEYDCSYSRLETKGRLVRDYYESGTGWEDISTTMQLYVVKLEEYAGFATICISN